MTDVAIILGDDIDNIVYAIANEMPVWISSTKMNDVLFDDLRKIWNSDWSITKMNLSKSDNIEESLICAMDDIEQHHGQVSGNTKYRNLHVYTSLKLDLDDEFLNESGFDEVDVTPFGYIIRRQ